MILRVPDYYKEFSCIADKCRDSCCIGWEIDIDEDTYAFYKETKGDLGKKLNRYMYQTAEGDYSFELQKAGRCPFLNTTNLCEICIELGEEALSEVCTEYPRFTIEYGAVIQKCLSLSCEEVGRLVFTREDSVSIVDVPYGDGLVDEADMSAAAAKEERLHAAMLELVQNRAIAILQNKTKTIEERMREYLCYVEAVQACINEEHWLKIRRIDGVDEGKASSPENSGKPKEMDRYQCFLRRLDMFCQMETLDEEWENEKRKLKETLTSNTYNRIYEEFHSSSDYRELDYEQLMVYFTFRYFMNAVYDFDLLSYARFALVCTLMIRDMDLVRFHENGGTYTREERIDVARIFSKEVEHSEENVEFAKEECMFDERLYRG